MPEAAPCRTLPLTYSKTLREAAAARADHHVDDGGQEDGPETALRCTLTLTLSKDVTRGGGGAGAPPCR
jgi:hypothetical protein